MKTLILSTILAACIASPAMAKNVNGEGPLDYYFNTVDTNHDGVISKEEHDAFFDAKFQEADTNGDGVLSREEVREQRKRDMANYEAATGHHPRWGKQAADNNVPDMPATSPTASGYTNNKGNVNSTNNGVNSK